MSTIEFGIPKQKQNKTKTKTKQNKTKQNKTKQNKTKQNKTKIIQFGLSQCLDGTSFPFHSASDSMPGSGAKVSIQTTSLSGG